MSDFTINYELAGEWPKSHKRYASAHMLEVCAGVQEFLESENLTVPDETQIAVVRLGRTSEVDGTAGDGSIEIVFHNDLLAHRKLERTRTSNSLAHELSHVKRDALGFNLTVLECLIQEGVAYTVGAAASSFLGDKSYERYIKRLASGRDLHSKFWRIDGLMRAANSTPDELAEEIMFKRRYRGYTKNRYKRSLPIGVVMGIKIAQIRLNEGRTLAELITITPDDFFSDSSEY